MCGVKVCGGQEGLFGLAYTNTEFEGFVFGWFAGLEFDVELQATWSCALRTASTIVAPAPSATFTSHTFHQATG